MATAFNFAYLLTALILSSSAFLPALSTAQTVPNEDPTSATYLRRLSLTVNRPHFQEVNFLGGRTFDVCFPDDKCKGDRKCTSTDGAGGPCESRDFCLCLPRKFTLCSKRSDCSKGETCAHTPGNLHPVCASKVALKIFSFIEKVEDKIKIPRNGLTLDACETTDDCSEGRSCSLPTLKGFAPCRGERHCLCIPASPIPCFATDGCANGEVCTNALLADAPVCASTRAAARLTSVSELEQAPSEGFTLDTCSVDADCEGKRKCRRFKNNKPTGPCEGSFSCACAPNVFPKCAATSDCASYGEMCADTVFARGPTCVSYEAWSWNGVRFIVGPETCPVLIPRDFPSKTMPEPISHISLGEAVAEKKSNDLAQTSRIVGGQFVSEELYPYLAHLDLGRGFCSAALISPRWALTAAHCMPKPSSMVSLGTPIVGNVGKSFRVKKAFIHPGFTFTDVMDDIAVVELEDGPLNSSQFMKLNEDAAIPERFFPVRSLGYGLSSFQGAVKDKFQFSLKQVDIPVTAMPDCIDAYGGLDPPLEISPRAHLCAGVPRGGCGACNGDSGGPLIDYVKDEPTIVGVTSFGVNCAFPKFPGVYARVSSYISWIKSTGAVFYTDSGVFGEDADNCKAGEFTYSVNEKVKFCRQCADDETSAGGKGATCTKCENGMKRDAKDGSKCSCKGKYAVGMGMKDGKCVKCKAGSFSGEKDNVCRLCPKGSVSAEAGSEECSKCAKGTSSPVGGTKCRK